MPAPGQRRVQSRRTAFTVAGACCVLLLWLAITALPGPRAPGEPPPDLDFWHSPGARFMSPMPHEEPRRDGWSAVSEPLPHGPASWPPGTPSTGPRTSRATQHRRPCRACPRPRRSSHRMAFPLRHALHLRGWAHDVWRPRTDSDCPADHGCVANRETRRFECMSSDCEEDVHCFPGFVCRAATLGNTGRVIRRCTPDGVRLEGETCDRGYISRAGSCREGLRCVGGRCAGPCRLDDPEGVRPATASRRTRTVPAAFRIAASSGVPRGSGASASVTRNTNAWSMSPVRARRRPARRTNTASSG